MVKIIKNYIERGLEDDVLKIMDNIDVSKFKDDEEYQLICDDDEVCYLFASIKKYDNEFVVLDSVGASHGCTMVYYWSRKNKRWEVL
jgi:hypothetical protein